MARLCIRVAPNDHPTDASLTPLRTRPGDVVEIKEDGWQWRPGEVNSGQYRFVDVPGVPESDLVHLRDSRWFEFPDGQQVMVRRRNQCLDSTVLSSGPWRTRTSATRNQINAITITRT